MNMPQVSEVCLSLTERVPLCLSVWQCVLCLSLWLRFVCVCLRLYLYVTLLCVLIMTEIFQKQFLKEFKASRGVIMLIAKIEVMQISKAL